MTAAAVLTGVVLATVFMPLAGLTTASLAATEGGGGSPLSLIARAISTIYTGPYEAEALGWTPQLLVVLVMLAVVWFTAGASFDRGLIAIAAFCSIVVATNYLIYSNALNAIGFSPNLIVMYVFVPLIGLSGAGAAWLLQRVLTSEPAIRRRSVTYVVIVALLVSGVAYKGYAKAQRLRASARTGTFITRQDVEGLEWIRDHTRPDEGIVVDGLSDAGFWAAALAGRRTSFWYMGWPTLPPWARLSGMLKKQPEGLWEIVQLQYVGGEVTVRGLGPRPNRAGTSTLFISGSKASMAAGLTSDTVTYNMPEGSYVIALVYQPAAHPDAKVSVSVASPGGGKRFYKAADDQMRRRYFADVESAIAAARGARTPGIVFSDFDWEEMRREGYRYVFLGSRVGDPERRILDRKGLSRRPELREVWRSGGTVVYEIVPPSAVSSPKGPDSSG